MTRPIRFRGQKRDSGEWVYGGIEVCADGQVKIYPDISTLSDSSVYDHIWVDPETVGQLTGLHDKNGKEIWELNEVDSKYRVIYQAPSYVLQDISNGDILPLYDNTHEVTGEYSPLA